ncbi:MAG: hypothetical protein K8J31_25035 [Anaerolineae bacterium]|nr:hypothetical protein [Anaerolineae bacterium]
MIWIEILIRLLMVFFFGFAAVSQPVPRPETPPIYRSYTNILNVEVIVMESFPMQVRLHISGEHPEGCDLPVIVEQQRSGNTVTVEVYREVPADVMCPMILRPYDDTIALDGTFEPGDYTFKVNDFTVEQTL